MILILNLDLSISKVFSGNFVPKAMSLDESGNCHLTVLTPEGGKYWKLDSSGKLQLEVALNTAISAVPQPPVVGFDHRVYVQLSNHILQLDQDGKRRCSFPTQSIDARCLVTPKGQLLIADGKRLVVQEADCSTRVLMEFDVPICGMTNIVEGNRILVATNSKLYCLSAEE